MPRSKTYPDTNGLLYVPQDEALLYLHFQETVSAYAAEGATHHVHAPLELNAVGLGRPTLHASGMC